MTEQAAVEIETASVEVVKSEPVEVAALKMPDVGHLMEMAMGQGEAGVAALEKLVGLQERVLDRQAEMALSDALTRFKEECPQVRKTSTARIATKPGNAYSFNFAKIDEIDRTIRPHLKANGLSYTFDTVMQGEYVTVTCIVRHQLGASLSANFTCSTKSDSKRSAAQDAGAAVSFAQRYALSAALGLVTTTADADDLGSVVSAEKLSDGQLREIRGLLKESGADIDKFLRFVGVASLAEIPATSFTMAATFLKQKIAKDKAAKAKGGDE